MENKKDRDEIEELEDEALDQVSGGYLRQVQSGSAVPKSGAAAVKSGAAAVKSGAAVVKSGAAAVKSGAAAVKSGAAVPVKSGMIQ